MKGHELYFGKGLKETNKGRSLSSFIFFVIHPESCGPFQHRFLKVLGAIVRTDVGTTNGEYLQFIG